MNEIFNCNCNRVGLSPANQSTAFAQVPDTGPSFGASDGETKTCYQNVVALKMTPSYRPTQATECLQPWTPPTNLDNRITDETYKRNIKKLANMNYCC